MVKYALQSGLYGALYGALTGLITGFGLSLYWASDDLGGLLLLLVGLFPYSGMVGLVIGFPFYCVLGFIVSSVSVFRNSPIAAFTLASTTISITSILIICFVAEGISPVAVISGYKEAYLLLIPCLFVSTVTGILVGRKHTQLTAGRW